jgi:hypothetical protein
MRTQQRLGRRPLQKSARLLVQLAPGEVVLAGIADVETDAGIQAPNLDQLRITKVAGLDRLGTKYA